MSNAPVEPGRAPGALSSRRTILKILAVPLTAVVVIVSTVLLGSTSHERPTGKVAGLLMAATSDARLRGISPSHAQVAGVISSVNNHWGQFDVGPLRPSDAATVPAYYGYAHYEPYSGGWVIVASGTARVGCPSQTATARVPLAVIEGFGQFCPSR